MILNDMQRKKQNFQTGKHLQDSPCARWRKLGLPAIGVMVVLGSAVILIPRNTPSQSHQRGPEPTYTITRGDLIVTIMEQGTLESAENTEIKCRVRGQNTIIWVIESGSVVEPGDELVRLDTLAIEDAIAERTKYAHLTRSGAERAKANLARAELAIPEYLEGRYRNQLMNLEKNLVIAKSNQLTAQNMLTHAETMAQRGYVSGLELQEKRFEVTQAKLHVDITQTQINELTRFTKAMELERLQGNLNATRARYAAEAERAQMDAARRDLALTELEHCVIRAERAGLVIYPRAKEWKRTPDIEEGATVHQDQILLLMPDLSRMQVRVGMHESIVDRIKPGMSALITIPGQTIEGKVASVAPVTRPAGWWTGNVVKYDTIIQLPSTPGLKPGMSAKVEIILDRYVDILTIPITAVVETAQGAFCWIKTDEGTKRRSLELGDTNDNFAQVLTGLQTGEEVVLDALTSVEEAQILALNHMNQARLSMSEQQEIDHDE
ncbi:MAG: HlyD family efflux transporter periplasmic adaptor subunit [Planctomycetes bacterium]|nr:HlyD family efflux transporter periplasmic adaptor subunit [Planctomycetota bacterium]